MGIAPFLEADPFFCIEKEGMTLDDQTTNYGEVLDFVFRWTCAGQVI
jgi:hypothetical protein